MSASDYDHLIGSGRAPLISRDQVNDVLRNLSIKEGIFSEEDLKEIEHGYTVSETDNDDNESMSRRSADSRHIDGGNSMMSPDTYGIHNRQQMQYRPAPVASQTYNGHHQEHQMENRVRAEQEKSVLHSEIANQKSKYVRKLTNLEKLIEQMRGEKKQMQQVLETQKQNFKYQLLQQEQRTVETLTHIKDQQSKLQGQVPQFKEKLDQYKRELSTQNLLVSEESYVELKAKQEEQRSLKEFIQVKVYEALEKYQREIETLRRENDELVEENMNTKLKGDRDSREVDNIKKMTREREEDSRRRVDALERRNKELEADLHKINNQYKVILDRGTNQRDMDERSKQFEVDYRTMKSQNEMLESQISKLTDGKLEVERRSEALRREIDLLNQDKTFLTRENTSLEERFKRLEDKLDRNEQELLESKKAAHKYMERVLNTNDDVKSKFDQQYSKEITDLKDRHTKELELAKQNLVDIYERKNDYLKERKDESERRVMKLEQDLKDKSKSYEEILFEFRQLQRAGDEELGLLKLAVRSKQDEYQRISHLYEDNMVLVKELKMENETLKQKMGLVQSEYYKLESMGRQNNADIKAELAVCRERLGNYEMIEKELDQAIMNVAQSDGVIDSDGTNDIGNALIQTITNAPTTAKRRIQQSLLLSNRLQAKQREVESLQQEIKVLTEKLENYENESKLHKRMLDKTNQPYSYMIADIEKSEKELNYANKKIKQLEETLKKMRSENDQLKLSKKGINEDLQKLLSRRQDIENLQTTLQGIIMHSSAKKIDVEELKIKLAESIRQNRFKGDSSPMKKEKENIMRKLNGAIVGSAGNKSKSPSKFSGNYLDDMPEKGSNATLKMGSQEQSSGVPAWYSTLKRQVGK